jgi:hypothetical protein
MKSMKLTLAALVLAAGAVSASATPSMSVSGYSQDFNAMGTGTTFLDGWSATSIAGSHDDFRPADDPLPSVSTTSLPTGSAINGGTAVTMVAATPAAQKTANAYNWAVGGSTTERSLGTTPTGNKAMTLQLILNNGTGAAVNSLNIGYDVRVFSTTTNNNNYSSGPYVGIEELPGYWLFYSLDGGATYTNVSQLNADGKTWANVVGTVHEAASNVALAGTWAAGAPIYLRWVDDNAQGPSPDQLIGLDNLSISATPEPATLSLLAVGGVALLRRRWMARTAGRYEL